MVGTATVTSFSSMHAVQCLHPIRKGKKIKAKKSKPVKGTQSVQRKGRKLDIITEKFEP